MTGISQFRESATWLEVLSLERLRMTGISLFRETAI